MKEIIYNDDKIKDSEVDEVVIRNKGLIINDNNEILLGYCNKTYQFPGGHLEQNETLYEGLKREIKEETGITLKNIYEPVLLIKYYTKNYRNTNKTRLNKIYYYYIKTNEHYHLDELDLDEYEKKGNYKLKYVNLENIEDLLLQTIKDKKINEVIVKEMLMVLKEVL